MRARVDSHTITDEVGEPVPSFGLSILELCGGNLPVMRISQELIRARLAAGLLDFTVHAIFEAAADLVFVEEIEGAITAGEIIEDDAERGRCLVCGPIPPGGLLHIVVDYADMLADPESSLVVVTVYRPDPDSWIDGRIRRN